MLNELMESLFSTLSVTSWSIYERNSLIFCNIRFCKAGNTNGYVPRKLAYRKKNDAQVLRDRQRAENFRRPNARLQNIDDMNEIEIIRQCNNEVDRNTDISEPPLLHAAASITPPVAARAPAAATRPSALRNLDPCENTHSLSLYSPVLESSRPRNEGLDVSQCDDTRSRSILWKLLR